MAKTRVAPTGKPSTSPEVRWLFKPGLEVEAAARWFRCRKEPDDAGAVGAKGKPCYLCADYTTRARSRRECWRQTHAMLREVLDGILASTFRNKSTVTVIDWLRSFSSPYDRPTLRVEVIGRNAVSAAPEAYIVKIALAGRIEPKVDVKLAEEISDRLERELKGYRYLGARGKRKAGPAFATLEPGCREGGRLQSLKYSDAEQTLRAGDAVVTLERAVLDACEGGRRSLESVEASIVQLFAELEDAWYRHAWAAPTTPVDYLQQRLEPGLTKWLDPRAEARAARDEVLWALRGHHVEFVDPVLYFNPASWPKTPEILVGTSHGDLHGRNVLVGIIEGEARWPVVFDYEDVTCCNAVAWDFVKLETELKKVALSDPAFLPAANDADLIQQLCAFELDLDRQTERSYHHNDWLSPLPHEDDRRSRLRHVILTIRRMAWKCLELQRGRSGKWLHEYYFLLAAYGVYAARFSVFREVRPLKSLFVGAGMAAYRHAYGEDLGSQAVALREVDALDWIARGCSAEQGTAGPETAGEPAPARPQAPESDADVGEVAPGAGNPGVEPWTNREIRIHRGDMAYAKRLARSRDAACVKQAVAVLQDLMRNHPFVLELAYECAFALLELAQLERRDDAREGRWRETDRLLKRAEVRFRGQMHQELLSRRGRLHKDQADVRLREGDTPRAEALYEEAAGAYEKAVEVSEARRKYYPAINAATCWWLAGPARDKEKRAEKWAANVLTWVVEEEEASREDQSAKQLMWVLATKGEAHVIAGRDGWCDEARSAYEEALEIARREGTPNHESSAMILQLERILKVMRDRVSGDPRRAKDAEDLETLIVDLKRRANC